MKKLSYLLIAVLFVFNCSQDNIEESMLQEDALIVKSSNESNKKPKKAKVEICHFNEGTKSWVKLSISENGLNGHAKHANDIINFDKDGDGYPVMNECGINFRDDGFFDCDDEDAQKHPMDMDGDGFTACDDCNDKDASLNPNTVWYADSDGDGYGDDNVSAQGCEQLEGFVMDHTDCDDTDAALNPALDSEGFSTCSPKPEPTGHFPANFDFQSLIGDYIIKYPKTLGMYENLNPATDINFSIIQINDRGNDYMCIAKMQYVVDQGRLEIGSYMYDINFYIDKSTGILILPQTTYNGVMEKYKTIISIEEGITYFTDDLEGGNHITVIKTN